MNKRTAIKVLFFVIASFFVLNKVSLAQNIETSVTVGTDTFSQLGLSPQNVEIAEKSEVLITAYNGDGTPKVNRTIQIYVDGDSSSVFIVQPPPTDTNGKTSGEISASVAGTYRVCGRDITGGISVDIQQCEMLYVTPVAVPTMVSEPQYTVGTSNTVSWGISGTNSYEYYVEVSTGPDFSSIVGSSGWISTLSTTFSDLSSGQIYYYRVKARNQSGGESGWSNYVYSVQEASAPEITLLSVVKPSNVTTENFNPTLPVTITYRIEDNMSVASREIWVILPSGEKVSVPFTTVLNGNVWTVNILLGDLPKDSQGNLFTAYSFYIEATDNMGNMSWDNSASVNFPIPYVPPVIPPEQPPVAQKPSNPGVPVKLSEDDDNTPTWTWVPSYGKDGTLITKYIVEWCLDLNFKGCESQSIEIDSNSFTHSTPLGLGEWFLRVRAVGDGDLVSDWVVVNFSVLEKKDDDKDDGEPTTPPSEEPEKPTNWFVTKVTEPVKQSVEKVLENTVGKLDQKTAQVFTVSTVVTNVAVGMGLIINMLGTIPYLLVQTSLAFLSLIGFRVKGNLSGYVYDSVTKDPIKQAIIRIFNEKNVLVWTDVSDYKGRFRSPDLESGKYYIKVTGRDYKYPSSIVVGETDFPLENIYRGGVFEVKDGNIPKFSIPLDQSELSTVKILSERFFSRSKWFWKPLHFGVFVLGLAFSAYAVKVNPVWWNYLILFMYIPSLVLLLFSLFGKKEKYGYVKGEEKNLLAGVTVHLLDSEFEKVVSTRVTDDRGRYRFLVDRGIYTIEVADKRYVLQKPDEYRSIKIKKETSFVLCPNLIVKRRV
ncbi:MAG TPA: hypothetical protein P5344_03115 [Candidatus Dojkabacteria bacterium]|nr:hypothetical protein [Candidatus Dojkabacteria bacterium]